MPDIIRFPVYYDNLILKPIPFQMSSNIANGSRPDNMRFYSEIIGYYPVIMAIYQLKFGEGVDLFNQIYGAMASRKEARVDRILRFFPTPPHTPTHRPFRPLNIG